MCRSCGAWIEGRERSKRILKTCCLHLLACSCRHCCCNCCSSSSCCCCCPPWWRGRLWLWCFCLLLLVQRFRSRSHLEMSWINLNQVQIFSSLEVQCIAMPGEDVCPRSLCWCGALLGLIICWWGWGEANGATLCVCEFMGVFACLCGYGMLSCIFCFLCNASPKMEIYKILISCQCFFSDASSDVQSCSVTASQAALLSEMISSAEAPLQWRDATPTLQLQSDVQSRWSHG